jgi:hypothetical protein
MTGMSRRVAQCSILLGLAALLAACASDAPGETNYAGGEASYRECHKLALEEGRLIKLISTTLRARHRANPDDEEVVAQLEDANAERRDIHHQRRELGCI